MTQREILARATLVTKIKKIVFELDLPQDPYLEKALYSAKIADIQGIYEGLQKMQLVRLHTEASRV